MKVAVWSLRFLFIFGAVLFWPAMALADNCGSLHDCWGTAAAAGGAAAGAGAAAAAGGGLGGGDGDGDGAGENGPAGDVPPEEEGEEEDDDRPCDD